MPGDRVDGQGSAACPACGRAITPATNSAVHRHGAETGSSILRIVLDRRVMGRATRIAIVIGTILTAINQGDALLSHHFTAAMVWKIALTYCVPYCVSTYTAISMKRQRA